MHTVARHALSLFGALALAAAPAAAQAQPADVRGPQTLEVTAAAETLNPLVRDELLQVQGVVRERTRGAVELYFHTARTSERELVLRARRGEYREGVLVTQEGVVDACGGAVALRTPRALSFDAFDRGLAVVREDVARTCARSLAPVAWFSAGERYLFTRDERLPNGRTLSLQEPRDLRGVVAGRFATAESRVFEMRVDGRAPMPFALQSPRDAAVIEADVPDGGAGRFWLDEPMGHALGGVLLGRAALESLAPEHRAAVEGAFREMETRLTAALRQGIARQGDPERIGHDAMPLAFRPRATSPAWRAWAFAVETRIADGRQGPILQRFLAAAGAAFVRTEGSSPVVTNDTATEGADPVDAAAPDAAPVDDAVARARQPTVTLTFDGVPAGLRQGDYESVMQREVPPRALACYERVLRIRPDAQAHVTLRLSVRADGSVALLGGGSVTSEAQVPQSAWSNCFRDAIRGLRVAPPPAPTEPFDQVVDYALR